MTLFKSHRHYNQQLKKYFFLFVFVINLFIVPIAQAIVVGVSADDPPLSSYADDKHDFYGFEVELMQNICKRINESCQFKPIIVSKLTQALINKQIDLAVAAIIIPDKNTKMPFIFSLPYLPSQAQFITKNTSQIKSLKQIKDHKVGVRLGTLSHGTLFKDYVLKMYNNQVETASYLTMSDLLAALNHGDVDAVFSNSIPLQYWQTNNPNIFTLVGKPITIGDGYCVMANKGQEKLIQKNKCGTSSNGTRSIVYQNL